MGEMVEWMLEGYLCQVCGKYLGIGTGHPRSCKQCDTDAQRREVLPPRVLADAKHDTVHEQSGEARPGKTAQRREGED